MAQLTGRDAVAAAIAQEMRRDERVILFGEDVESGGVFKATVGLLEEFGPRRVRNTPISEQAILGAAMQPRRVRRNIALASLAKDLQGSIKPDPIWAGLPDSRILLITDQLAVIRGLREGSGSK